MGYLLKLSFVGLATLFLGTLVIAVSPFDPRGRLAYRLSRLWSRAILRAAGARVEVSGLERLSRDRNYIFMANHQSNLDIPVLLEALVPFQLRLIAKRELARIPVFGWALWAAKHVLVDRGDPTRAALSLRRAGERIGQGLCVVVFPEGTRGSAGELLPFKLGGFLLAVRAQTPVVPVAILGSGRVLPKGSWRASPGEVRVIVHEPIPADRATKPAALMEQARAALASTLAAEADSAPRARASHG